jgi:hypothetical protein
MRRELDFGSFQSSSRRFEVPLPLAVVGGRLSGQDLRFPDRTPISNLLLTVLRRAKVPVDSIGDSTSECAGL